MTVDNMIDKKEIERACNSFFKEANFHVAGDIQDFDTEIILQEKVKLKSTPPKHKTLLIALRFP